MSWDTVKFNELYAVDSKNGIYKSAENHGTGTKIVNMGELFAYGFIGGQDMRRIEVTDKGRIFAAFYSGGTKETYGNFVVLEKSDDNGKTWTTPHPKKFFTSKCKNHFDLLS